MTHSPITFSILVNDGPEAEDVLRKAANRFSEGFHLEENVSKKILRCAPVLLLSGLSRSEVSDVKSILRGITEDVPVTFRITSAKLPSLPEVKWNEPPNFDDIDPGTYLSDVELQLNGNAITCPNCDDRLLLHRSPHDLPVADSSDHARLQTASRKPSETDTTDTSDSTEQKPEPEAQRPTEPEPEPIDASSEQPSSPAEEAIEEPIDEAEQHDVDHPTEDADTAEFEQEEEILSSDPEQGQAGGVSDEPDGGAEMEEVPDLESDDDEMDALFDDLDDEDDEHEDFLAELDEELSELEEMDFEGTNDDTRDQSSSPAPETPSTPSPGTQDHSDSDSTEAAENAYNVFISGAGSSDPEQIVSLLCDIRGCTTSEAQDLVERPITPVENGISKERAHEIERRFNQIGVSVNITEQ